jgi:5-methylcytosine-specific restriction protein A
MMPTAPLRVCLEPGCYALAHGPRCPVHTQARQVARDQRRGNSADRGYDAQWRRIRDLVLAGHPPCACGCGREADSVDHVTPLAAGGARLDAQNLQPMYHACNARKGAR